MKTAEEMSLLAERARSGDPEAFASLYEIVYKDLYRYALYMLGQKEDAEDVVSETVMAAYAQIGQLKSAGAFRAWIFRILSNKCRKQRAAYLEKVSELDEQMPDRAGDFTEESLLKAAMASLSEEEREIICLHIFGGYKSHEIGLILQMNPATVRSREHRALEKLKKSQRSS